MADGCRGLSDDEAESGHTAPWNNSWFVHQVDDNVEMYKGEDIFVRSPHGVLPGPRSAADDER